MALLAVTICLRAFWAHYTWHRAHSLNEQPILHQTNPYTSDLDSTHGGPNAYAHTKPTYRKFGTQQSKLTKSCFEPGWLGKSRRHFIFAPLAYDYDLFFFKSTLFFFKIAKALPVYKRFCFPTRQYGPETVILSDLFFSVTFGRESKAPRSCSKLQQIFSQKS